MVIRILVVDDHAIIRDGLRFLCDHQSDLEVVAEAANGEEALARYDEARPDVVVMDIGMPVMDGVEATSRLLELHPEARVVALSMHADPVYVELMRDRGALGYVLKDEVSEALASALRAVMAGQTAFGVSPNLPPGR